MFDHHIKEIENPDFQIQFVALGGYSVLELVLEQHEYVRSLITSVSSDDVQINEVYERILYLLPRVETEVEQSSDGSIVVYLHCLSKFDLTLSYEASVRIGNTRGLFWSRRMARTVVKRYWERKISDSVTLSSTFGHQLVHIGDAAIVARLDSDVSTSVYHANDSSRKCIQHSHSIEFAHKALVAV